MCHRVWACEQGACFTVLPLAVAEEQGIGRTVAVSEYARLSHEATRQGDPVSDGRSALDNEIVRNDVHPDVDRCLLAGYDATVAQSGCTLDFSAVSDLYIDNVHRIEYLDILPNYTEG